MSARTLIFTGEGKGKTTAALGMVLRAAGHHQRVLVIQFLKSNLDTGELAALARFPEVEVVQMGLGFVPARDHPAFAAHQEAARNALAYAGRAVKEGPYQLIVLDEICLAVARTMIPEESVLEMIACPERTACLVLTGRGATAGLIELADTVTECRCIKHGFQTGIPAQKGVEW